MLIYITLARTRNTSTRMSNTTNNEPADASKSEKKGDNDSEDIRKISLTPFLTELLNPTAKYLGEELKTYVKSKIEEKKKKVRSENLRMHLAALEVNDKSNARPLNFDEVKDLEFFDAWAEGAQDASQSEPELFNLWQSILHGVMDRKIADKYIIEKARQLTPDDARLLNTIRWFGVRAFSKDKHAVLQRLEHFGFLSKSHLALWIPAIIFSLPLLVFAARGLVGGDENLGLLLFSGGFSVLVFWGQIALGYLLFFTVIAIYPLWNGGSVASWHLSPLGHVLVNLTTQKTQTTGRKYSVYHHATLGHTAVKIGFSFPALFFGPLWVSRNKLGKVFLWQLAFVLVYSFAFSDLNIKALPLSIGYAMALASRVSGPLLFLVLFILPAVKGNDWVAKSLTRNGYDYFGTTYAKTKLAAIAYIQKQLDSRKQSAG